jgi:hypothetical protein
MIFDENKIFAKAETSIQLKNELDDMETRRPYISFISNMSKYNSDGFLAKLTSETDNKGVVINTNTLGTDKIKVVAKINEYLGIMPKIISYISSTSLTEMPEDFSLSYVQAVYDAKESGNFDFDNDKVNDYFEIAFKVGLNQVNRALIKVDDNTGLITLPTFGDCHDYLEETGLYVGIKEGYEKFLTSGPYDQIRSIRVLPINSDPLNADGDNDEYDDYDEIMIHDSNPLVCDVVEYNLKNEFFEVTGTPENKVNSGYGGNQSWFLGDGNKTNYQLVNGGCGVIASADALLYLYKYHNNATINVNIDGETISWVEYESFVRNYSDIYLTPFDLLIFTNIDTAEEINELSEDDILMKISKGALTWGTIFPKVVSAVNNFNTVRNGSYRLALQDTFYSKEHFEQIIINSLNKDMPILLSYGVSSIPLSIKVIEGADAGKDIKSMHMMNVIGMKTDNITKDTKLIVVSWSRIIEIDLDEYYSNRGYFGGIACFY